MHPEAGSDDTRGTIDDKSASQNEETDAGMLACMSSQQPRPHLDAGTYPIYMDLNGVAKPELTACTWMVA